MTHPDVYCDAWRRASDICQEHNMLLCDILSQNYEITDTIKPFTFFETSSNTSDRLGLGENINEENGKIFLHLMMPRGSPTLHALEIIDDFSAIFRKKNQETISGLFYQSQNADPPSADDTGNYARFTLAIDYIFQNILESDQNA